VFERSVVLTGGKGGDGVKGGGVRGFGSYCLSPCGSWNFFAAFQKCGVRRDVEDVKKKKVELQRMMQRKKGECQEEA